MNAQQIIETAKSEKWKRKQVKQVCYSHKVPVEEREEIYAALGFAPTTTTTTTATTEATSKVEVAKPVPPQLLTAIVEPEPVLLEDGAVIWCDAAENTVIKVVNCYGRQRKLDNGGYRVGLYVGRLCGNVVERHYNTKCPDQFAGECWAILKAVELAIRNGIKSCVIRNDRVGGFGATKKKGYIGTKYLYVAKKMADENGLAVEFNLCSSAENLADRVSRSER